jgi:hypothetical protein
MSSHDLTIAGYLLVAASGILLTVLAHRPAARIPAMAAVFGWVMHTRTGRIAVIAWWAWLGMHLFSR